MSQNLSSATVVIGALRVKAGFTVLWQKSGKPDGREIKKILAMKILLKTYGNRSKPRINSFIFASSQIEISD